MNKKIYILLGFFLFFAFFKNRALCVDTNPFQACYSIKDINPDASELEYYELVKSLNKKHLSVCTCVKTLMKEKYERWIKENNEKTGNEIWLTNLQYGLLLDSGKLTALDIQEDIPYTTKVLVEKTAMALYNNESKSFKMFNISVVKGDDTACRIARSDLYIEAIISLSDTFFNWPGDQQFAVLHHEMWHAIRQHPASFFLDKETSPFFKKYPEQFMKLWRIMEKDADMCPLACSDSLIVAEGSENFHLNDTTVWQQYALSHNLAPENKHNFYSCTEQEHSISYSRHRWAKKIRRLKEAEMKLHASWKYRFFGL